MAPDQKKRHVVSYENMSEALAAAFNEKYPRGFSDYLPDLIKYPKPDGTSFYAVTVETEDSINLVKIKVKTDDAEALERWLEERRMPRMRMWPDLQLTLLPRQLFRTTTSPSTVATTTPPSNPITLPQINPNPP